MLWAFIDSSKRNNGHKKSHSWFRHRQEPGQFFMNQQRFCLCKIISFLSISLYKKRRMSHISTTSVSYHQCWGKIEAIKTRQILGCSPLSFALSQSFTVDYWSKRNSKSQPAAWSLHTQLTACKYTSSRHRIFWDLNFC